MILASPQILAIRQVFAKLVASGALVTAIPGSLKRILEFLRQKFGVLRQTRVYVRYMVHWKWDYKGCPAAWWPPQGGWWVYA